MCIRDSIESIADLVKDKRVEGISNIDDHSDRNGMYIVIDVKRDASPQIVLNHLFTFTQMQTTFGVIMLAIVNGEPKLLNLRQILEEYIKFQMEVITRRTLFELARAKERAHIFEALKVCLLYTSISSRAIRPAVPPSRGGIATSRPSSPCGVRCSTWKRPGLTRCMATKS